MIFGFNIIQGIAEDTAAAILKAAGTEPGQYTSQPPVNNAIRNLCVNRARNHYFLRVDVHAGVLLCGKETTDIQWVRPPDFDRLDESFRHHLSDFSGTAAPNRCFLCGTGPCGRWYMEWRSMRNILATCSVCWLIRICLPPI